VQCTDEKYTRWQVVVILLLCLDVIAIPVGIIALLLKNRASLFPLDNNRFARRFGVLYEQYTPRSFFWEVVVLLRRTILIVLQIFLTRAPQWKFMGFIVLCLLSLLTHVMVHPFQNPLDNKLEAYSLSLLVIVAAILTADSPPFVYLETEVILSVLILLPIAAFVVFFVLLRLRGRIRGSKVANDHPLPSTIAMTAVPTPASREEDGFVVQ
jgi:hypothetical protein